MKLFGISGAQGAGKTTMLNELATMGYTVDDFKVSRAVQKLLAWDTLENVMLAPKTMMIFQVEIFKQKYARDFALNSSSDLDAPDAMILTERTFADLFAYTSLWTRKFIDRGELSAEIGVEFINEYASSCRQAQQELYDGVILLPLMDHVVWEHDANRASFEDACTVFDYTSAFTRQSLVPTHTITSKSVADRASEAKTFFSTF